jgi:hypothetical protein
LDVVITRYILVRFRERAKGNPSALVEIFTNGLCLLTMTPSCALTTDDFWTLSHFHQVEYGMRQEIIKFRSEDLHNIIGTVDAISPIDLDPKDPFILVELYDQDNPNKSCILILNEPCALLWQPSIQRRYTRLAGTPSQNVAGAQGAAVETCLSTFPQSYSIPCFRILRVFPNLSDQYLHCPISHESHGFVSTNQRTIGFTSRNHTASRIQTDETWPRSKDQDSSMDRSGM